MLKTAPVLMMTSATLPSPAIVDITTPTLERIVEPPFAKSAMQSEDELVRSLMLQQNLKLAKEQLIKKYGLASQPELALLDRFDFRPLTPEGKNALKSTLEVYQELIIGRYRQESALTYLHFCTQLFANHLSGGALEAQMQVEQFKTELTKASSIEYSVRPEEERGHNPSWIVHKKGIPDAYAILKESVEIKLPPEIALHHPLCFSSFLQHLPDIPLTTTVTDHEIIGYEMDALFGFDRTPVTLKASFTNGSGAPAHGIIQRFEQNAEPIGNFIYLKDRAKELVTLDPSKVHLACLSGMFKGVGAHHIGNYLMVSESGKLKNVLEIDLEEIMPPYNKVPSNVLPASVASLDDPKCQIAQKAIVLCRLVLLGLPQAKKPLDRAFLMTICHPSFQALLKGYHAELSKKRLVHPSCLIAQQERLDMLQKLSSEALDSPIITLTARDLYFDLFGGREQYEVAKKNGYPDITAFNNVISDPYQDVIKDFSNPSNIKPSSSLEPIKASDSEEDIIRKTNLQELERLTSLGF